MDWDIISNRFIKNSILVVVINFVSDWVVCLANRIQDKIEMKERFKGNDLWEKIDGNKRMIGAIIFGVGLIAACIPFAQSVSAPLLSAGGMLWGIGEIHKKHKQNNSGKE